jgi:hypothetical protein
MRQERQQNIRKAKKKKKKAKKMAKKVLKKMIKKEQAKYTHSIYYEVPHHYHNFWATTLVINFILRISEILLISMVRTIPNGLTICKCTSTGLTLLSGKLWL